MLKKTFKAYVIIWAVCLVLFNMLAFLVPNERQDNFWVGYVFITTAFIGQLICANISFKAENAQKFFYNFPLISVSFIGTVAMLFFGGLSMAISVVPVWVGIVVCSVVLALTAIAIINASVVSETVSKVDEKIKTQTLFIKTLTADAQTLMAKANTPETQTAAKKVYEALLYSDPVSNEVLTLIESQITIAFHGFQTAVSENSLNAVSLSEDLLVLIADRNTKCKLLK